MLNQIELNNFQSHFKTTLELSDKLTAITGSSDSGKSSVIRAIKWLVTNRPTGTAFQSHFIPKKGSTKVSLQFDGTSVSRIRSKSRNSYELGKEKFDVVRTDVPDEITQFVNLDPELNIQGQHDRYFLLQDSSGEVAKKLNKVADLEIIDFVLKETDSRIRKNTQDIHTTESNIEEINEDLKPYENLNEIENLIKLLDNQLEKYNKTNSDIQTLQTAIETITETQEEIKQIDEWLKIEKESEKLFELIEEFNETEQLKDTLYNLTTRIEDLKNEITSIEKFLEIEESLNNLEILINEYFTLSANLEKLQTIVKSIEKYEKTIDNLSKKEENITQEITEILNEYPICPFCGREISKDQIQKHIESWL